MSENPFHKHTPIVDTHPSANKKLIEAVLGKDAAEEYAGLTTEKEMKKASEGKDTTLTQEEVEVVTEHHRIIPEEITALLEEAGSPAVLDRSIKGGVVSIDIPPQITEWSSAQIAFETTDNGSPVSIWQGWTDRFWESPSVAHLDIIALSYNASRNIGESLDYVLADLNRIGLRLLTAEEMILTGIAEPIFSNTKGISFIGAKYTFGPEPYYPVMRKKEGKRELHWLAGNLWDDMRFLCVRK